MTKIKTGLILTTMFVSFSIMAGEAANVDDASAAINKAKSARLEAKKRGFEWSTTKKLITMATEASSNGDSASAIKLAERALREAKNSIKQADYAAKNWQKFVL